MTEDAALASIRVLDLSSLYAGPYIATLLGDFGADVIKVEHPRGDDARRWGLAKGSVPLWWKTISRNKRLICLDLHDESDRLLARRLAVEWADVVIENFRPGRLEQWGLGYSDLAAENPGLVMVRVTGFGQTGPYRNHPGFGTLAEAFAGFAAITGEPDGPPTLPPFGLADGVAALTGAYATMVALHWRDTSRDGRGQMIDLSLYEPLLSILGPQVTEFTQTGVVQQRQGNRSNRTSPRNAYRTADDRWVALSGGTQQIANRIMTAVGRPELADDPRFSSPPARRANADELDRIVADWIARNTQADVLAAFEAVEAPIAPVNDAESLAVDPHVRARESIIDLPDDDLGTITTTGIIAKLSATPGRVRHTGRVEVGADTTSVLADLTAGRRTPAPAAETDGVIGDGRRPWDDLVTDIDRQTIRRSAFGRRVGIGPRPALLVIDAQNYMVGPPPGSTHEYPSACPSAAAALPTLRGLIDHARSVGVPVIYTQWTVAPGGSDIGVYGRKRDILTTQGWALEGSEGAQIHDAVAPESGDLVLVKKKPSAFHGTPLLNLLIDRGIDTVIVTGGATSNCVRATTIDSASYNFRTIVVEDCVFDRIDISHRIALFDVDRQFADVMPARDVMAALPAPAAGETT
ncbi:isochorismatase family protein [Solwaraspora sp. WMMD406]|uniref:isochorismatase family protein n=1 Tax=Solwaraspora sp. WMMD406 TaxID=3016095 RepID=UPI002415C021|nr:isochorismatase family protein [Solwaraspora sp. WMMD406]MDG4762547.1 isochorismatase family protein [Solwaraspora sp. WMMD406]